MCRRNQILSLLMVGFGVGLLIGCHLESSFWCTIFGIGSVLFGLLGLQKGKS
jgi:hypothetical protein